MYYYARISRQGRSKHLVEFPDLPGCLTEGDSRSEALSNAKEALDAWLAASCDRELNIPSPTKRDGKKYEAILVGLQIEFAIQLRRIRQKKRLSQAAVAKRLGISQQAYAKLEMPKRTNPSLSTLERISKALEVEWDLKLVA